MCTRVRNKISKETKKKDDRKITKKKRMRDINNWTHFTSGTQSIRWIVRPMLHQLAATNRKITNKEVVIYRKSKVQRKYLDCWQHQGTSKCALYAHEYKY